MHQETIISDIRPSDPVKNSYKIQMRYFLHAIPKHNNIYLFHDYLCSKKLDLFGKNKEEHL